MRIGIDASRAFVEHPTGTERYGFELITRMLALPEAKEHEWILYTRSNFKFSILNFKSNHNIKIKIIPYKFLWTQVGLASRTWLDGLDVLWVPAHTLPVFRKPGIKTVVTIHGIEYEWLPAYENALQRWYLPLSTKYAVWSANKIIAVSEFTKRQLVERLGADKNKIEVIYEGITTSPLTPLQIFGEGNKRGEVIKKYGLKAKNYLLFVGTVQPRKNLVKLIEAFANLLRLRGGDLKLVIAGKLGWMYDEILDAPEKYGVKDNVIFTGYINDAERYTLLEYALVYLQPSVTEGFGLPVLEAMAAGVPVVSSSGGALGEITGGAAKLFDPGNVEDMTRKISEVVSSMKMRNEMIIKGKGRMLDFSWDKAALKTLKLLIV